MITIKRIANSLDKALDRYEGFLERNPLRNAVLGSCALFLTWQGLSTAAERTTVDEQLDSTIGNAVIEYVEPHVNDFLYGEDSRQAPDFPEHNRPSFWPEAPLTPRNVD